MSFGADVHFIGENSGLTQFQQDLQKGLEIKQAGDAVKSDQIKDETVIGGAAEVAYPIGVTDRVQARPFVRCEQGLRMWRALVSMSVRCAQLKPLRCRAIL